MKRIWQNWEKISFFQKAFSIGLLVICVGSAYAVAHENRSGILTVAFLDVGQGDGIFIDTPSGNQFLIDAGPNNKVLHSLAEVMPFYDRSIDMVLPTHPDLDHMGGFVPVLERFRVTSDIEPGIETDKAFEKTFETAVAEKHLQKIIARRGERLHLDSDVTLDVLYPDRDVTHISATNDGCVVSRLTYKEKTFLFTCDAPIKVEQWLLTLGTNLHADVLKVGHHGSRNSTSDAFLAAVAPEYAVISSGKNNPYGHPHKEVTDKLSAAHIKTLNTQDLGTIVFTTDGTSLNIKTLR